MYISIVCVQYMHTYVCAVIKLSFFSSRCAIWGSQSRSQDQPQELHCKPSNVNPPPHSHAHVEIHRHVKPLVVIGKQQRLAHTTHRVGGHGRSSAHIYSEYTEFFISCPALCFCLFVTFKQTRMNQLHQNTKRQGLFYGLFFII